MDVFHDEKRQNKNKKRSWVAVSVYLKGFMCAECVCVCALADEVLELFWAYLPVIVSPEGINELAHTLSH